MVARGHVHNGVVVLEGGVVLPEGRAVIISMSPEVMRAATAPLKPHSILDIQAVSVGAVLRPLSSDDDLLGEMLEGRP